MVNDLNTQILFHQIKIKKGDKILIKQVNKIFTNIFNNTSVVSGKQIVNVTNVYSLSKKEYGGQI